MTLAVCENMHSVPIRLNNNWARTRDFQQCGILTSEDSEEPLLRPLSLETPNDVQLVA